MRKRGVSIFLSLVLIFMQTGSVWAEDQTDSNRGLFDLPHLLISNITLSETGITTKGSFEVENQNNYYIGNLNCVTEVYKAVYGEVYQGKNLIDWELINKTIRPFEIYPKEKETVNFIHTLPENVSSGNFRINIKILNSNGLLIGFNPKYMGAIQTNNIYLDSLPSQDRILNEGKEESVLSRPTYLPNESPTGYITFINSSDKALTVHPQINVYARGYKSKPVKIVEGDKIEFKPKEQKKVAVKLPGMEEPDSYIASVVMFDELENQISGMHEFRYLVKGSSAMILSVQAVPSIDKTPLYVSVLAVGPADATEIKSAQVEVKIYDDKTNDLINQESQNSDLGMYLQTINLAVNLDKKASDIRIETSLKYQDKTLDTNILKVPGAVILQEKERSKDVVGTPYEFAVGKLIDLGIINGYPDGTFRPEQNITRAEFVKLICMLLDKQSDIDKSTGMTKFKDIAKKHWAGKYIDVAAANDIVKGYPGGKFEPESNVTYAEAVTVLVRLLGYQKEMDEQQGKWPDNYISKAWEVGVTAGIKMDKSALAAKRGDIALLVWNTYKELKNRE